MKTVHGRSPQLLLHQRPRRCPRASLPRSRRILCQRRRKRHWRLEQTSQKEHWRSQKEEEGCEYLNAVTLLAIGKMPAERIYRFWPKLGYRNLLRLQHPFQKDHQETSSIWVEERYRYLWLLWTTCHHCAGPQGRRMWSCWRILLDELFAYVFSYLKFGGRHWWDWKLTRFVFFLQTPCSLCTRNWPKTLPRPS